LQEVLNNLDANESGTPFRQRDGNRLTDTARHTGDNRRFCRRGNYCIP
jgi:hypothetical protein